MFTESLKVPEQKNSLKTRELKEEEKHVKYLFKPGL